MSVETLFNIPQKENISIREIVEKGIMTRKTIYKHLYDGDIIGLKIGKKWYIPRKELIRFLSEALQKGINATREITWVEKERAGEYEKA